MKLLRWGLGLAVIAFASQIAAAQQALPQTLTTPTMVRIEAQPLRQAIIELMAQTGVQFLYGEHAIPAELKAPMVAGKITPEEALRRLLDHSGLTYFSVNPRTVTIVPEEGAERKKSTAMTQVEREPALLAQASHNDGISDTSETSTEELDRRQPDGKLQEVVVTGSHIRGVNSQFSPTTIYDRQDIERSGAATLEQFARLIPENFASVDAPSGFTANATGFDQSGSNRNVGAGLNLHGLGPSATLTLLNGHRLSPAGADGQFVDVSLIPMSSVERIEILSDAASAIYGADAIAGVVNIILKKDFVGAETTLNFLQPTRGGNRGITGSQLLGHSWGAGNAMLVYEHNDQTALLARKRDFIPEQGGPFMLYPEQKRDSIFVNGVQRLTERMSLSTDAYYAERQFVQDVFSAGGFLVNSEGTSRQYGGTLAAIHTLSGDWNVELAGSYSKLQQPSTQSYPSFGTPGERAVDSFATDTDLMEFNLRFDGTLFSVPAGNAKAAFGAETRREHFRSATSNADAGTTYAESETDLDRRLWSAFGELLIPLLGDQADDAARRGLTLSLAARYDHYNDFDAATSPKAGLSWKPNSWINLRGTYSKSFHPPLLSQLNPTPLGGFILNLPNAAAAAGFTTTLALSSAGNPDLAPEKATSFAAGFDLTPMAVQGLTISATYFHTDYNDRIALPPTVGGIFGIWSETDTLAPFFDLSPNLAEVAVLVAGGTVVDTTGRGADGVEAIFDFRQSNIAKTEQSGVELSSNYGFDTGLGRVYFSLAANRLLHNTYRAVITVPDVSLKDKLAQPVGTRLNASVSWSRGGLSSALRVDYWNRYQNPLFEPAQPIGAWTIANLNLAYKFSDASAATLLDQLAIAVTVQNLTDRAPPRVQVPVGYLDIGFDSRNASALGRTMSVTLNKRW